MCSGHTNRTWCNMHTNQGGNIPTKIPCPSNATTNWVDSTLIPGILIKGIHVNELQNKIKAEETRREISQSSFESVNSSQLIEFDTINELRDSINRMEEQTCLCNCNYTCTCHVHANNYCTCQSNYSSDKNVKYNIKYM